MDKTEDIRVEALYSEDLIGPGEFYAKGHVSPEEFLRALAHHWGKRGEAADVQHTVARIVPTSDRDMGGLVFVVPAKPGRGAFLVTYIGLEHLAEITPWCHVCGDAHDISEHPFGVRSAGDVYAGAGFHRAPRGRPGEQRIRRG